MAKIVTIPLSFGFVRATDYNGLMHLYWPVSRDFAILRKPDNIYISYGCTLDSCIRSGFCCDCPFHLDNNFKSYFKLLV